MNKDKFEEINELINDVVGVNNIDEENLDNIVEGWNPSLRGCGIKWNPEKRKWIVMKK